MANRLREKKPNSFVMHFNINLKKEYSAVEPFFFFLKKCIKYDVKSDQIWWSLFEYGMGLLNQIWEFWNVLSREDGL